MSVIVTWNGTNFIIPQTNEVGWGTNLTDYLVSLPAGALQKTGGSFTLSAETDFGASFGLKSLYYKSRSSNISSTGILRLNNNSDAISWRNFANSGDLALLVNASNQLTFNGVPIVGAGLFTASRAVITDGSGNFTTSTTTSAELAFVSGVTSAIQTQLDNRLLLSGGTLTGDLTFSSGKGIFWTDSGTNTVKLTAPTTITSTYTLKWPVAQGASNQFLTNDGAGNLSWTNAAGTGTVNSGTQYQLAYYPASTNIVGGTSSITTNANNQLLVIDGTTSIPAYSFTSNPDTGFYLTSNSIRIAFDSITTYRFEGNGVAGSSTNLQVTNPDNTDPASHAMSTLAVAGASGGDPYTRYNVSGVSNFSAGIDNSVSGDPYVISAASTLGTNNVLSITSAGIATVTGAILGADGTAALPSFSFSSDTDTGMYRAGANSIGFATGGSSRWTIDSNGSFLSALSGGTAVIRAPNGTAASPAFSFTGDTGTGIYRSAVNTLGFAAAGALHAQMDGNGNFVIGTAALATTDTDGFLYIESCAGTPTGVPTTFTGRVATVYDTTNNKLYIYNGAWKSVTLT